MNNENYKKKKTKKFTPLFRLQSYLRAAYLFAVFFSLSSVGINWVDMCVCAVCDAVCRKVFHIKWWHFEWENYTHKFMVSPFIRRFFFFLRSQTDIEYVHAHRTSYIAHSFVSVQRIYLRMRRYTLSSSCTKFSSKMKMIKNNKMKRTTHSRTPKQNILYL